MLPDPCPTCRFDGDQYDDDDINGSLRHAARRWRHFFSGLDADVAGARPDGGWSGADHAARATDVTAAVAALLTGVLDDEPPVGTLELADPLAGPPREVADILREVDDAGARALAAASLLAGDGWRRTAVVDGREVDAAWLVRQAVHATDHHISHGGRALRAAGAGAPPAEGTVAQINVSGGGVPKTPVEEAAVGQRGLEGDYQAARFHHGRPWQALSLWSLERIEALREEGHDLAPGLAGENFTVAGIDWDTVRPGVRLQVGGVLAEVSCYATPCKKNARWFTDGDFKRMHHDRHPGWSRVYATVLRDGTVRAGDAVVVEP